MKEYYNIEKNYASKFTNIVPNNFDFKLSFINNYNGGNNSEYIEIKKEYINPKEQKILDIIKNNKSLLKQLSYSEKVDVRINSKGNFEIRLKNKKI